MSETLKKVLIIDDDEMMREQLSEEVRSKNMEAFQAHTVDEAVTILQEQHFDCIVLDILMQDKTSEEVLKHLKENSSENQYSPIILISAFATREFIKRNEDKVAKILPKPLNEGALSEALDEALFINLS